MSIPHFEVPSGAINGSNTVFTLSQSYQVGTTAVFVNGVLMQRDLEDGWFETNSVTGVITLKIAPTVGDVLQVFYTDLESDIEEAAILSGTIEDFPDIAASLIEDEIFAAVVE